MENASWTFCLLTFGCKVNQYETQSLREAWIALNGTETDDPVTADVVLVNTCAVTANAVADARQAVRRVHRDAPAARIIVTGCATEVERLSHHTRPATPPAPPGKRSSQTGQTKEGQADFSTMPGVFAVIGQKNKSALLLPLALLHNRPADSDDANLDSNVAQIRYPFPPFHIDGFRRARPVLKVQDGCSHGCAYCIVPFTRGPARSRSPKECLAEVRRLLAAGYREIMLSGINLRQYAYHAEDCTDFWDLVRFLDHELTPEWAEGATCDPARLRISSVDPAQLDARGIDCLAETRLICPHLHLSLQSGSPSVLQAMRRGHYDPAALPDIIQKISGFWPRMGLGADILMGFPGETDAHTQETLDLIRTLPLTYAHVFPFSVRPGTLAADLAQIPKPVRQQRAAVVRALVEQKRHAFQEASLLLDTVLVALDGNEDTHPDVSSEQNSSGPRGIDACYVPCVLDAPLHGQGHTLIPARPLRLEKNTLLVQALNTSTNSRK